MLAFHGAHNGSGHHCAICLTTKGKAAQEQRRNAEIKARGDGAALIGLTIVAEGFHLAATEALALNAGVQCRVGKPRSWVEGWLRRMITRCKGRGGSNSNPLAVFLRTKQFGTNPHEGACSATSCASMRQDVSQNAEKVKVLKDLVRPARA